VSGRQVVICDPMRSAVGRMGGALRDLGPELLGAAVLRGLLSRTGLRAEAVDEVIVGNCYPTMDAPAIGRVIALDAGLPVTATGMQIDRRCGSGLQAVIDAVSRVRDGVCDLVIAGGVESMSRAPFYNTDSRYGVRGAALVLNDSLVQGRVTAGGQLHPVRGGMVETAENLRREFSISRADQDALALRSHERAVQAQRTGVFAEEIVALEVPVKDGVRTFDTDEHPRADTDVRSLAKLRAVRAELDPESTVTAGNASGQNDGAAFCIVTTQDKATEYGLSPFGRLVSWAVAGVEPARMGFGPVPAVAKALRSAGLELRDIDLIEINEAFAAQVLACTIAWGFDSLDGSGWERTNVHGSGISLGHPVGATGVRILTTMLRELRRRGDRYALETMCIGGGQGLAAVFENVA